LLKNKAKQRTGGIAYMGEHLPSIHKVLVSITSTPKETL
jgi:hypothetical protein